jgi:hypothetical protein
MTEPLYTPTDIYNNNLPTSSSASFVGYIAPSEALDPNRLNQTIYSFILKSIRDDDQKHTALLERFLIGPQTVWRDIQEKIFSLKTLYDVTAIENNLLKYLKNIVGWTKDLNYITDLMGYEQLRRLISVSVILWKTKGPEDTTEDLLRYVLQTRVRIVNWFDYRWLIDENYLTFEAAGLDTWLLDLPGEGNEEYYSTLKIVDDGTLDRVLTRYMISLMRATGERIELYYLHFMDTFDVDGDDTQWNAYDDSVLSPVSMEVSGGTAKLSKSGITQSMIVQGKSSFAWGDYYFSAKLRADDSTTGLYGLWINGQSPLDELDAPIDGFKVMIDVVNNLIWFDNVSASFDSLGALYSNVWYDLTTRVRAIDGTTTRYEVYLDGELMITEDRTDNRFGHVGLIHEPDAVLEVSGVEAHPIPTNYELIDINQ